MVIIMVVIESRKTQVSILFLDPGKGKRNIDLYSASLRTHLTRSDMDHTVLPANTISAFTRKRSQATPPCIRTANA